MWLFIAGIVADPLISLNLSQEKFLISLNLSRDCLIISSQGSIYCEAEGLIPRPLGRINCAAGNGFAKLFQKRPLIPRRLRRGWFIVPFGQTNLFDPDGDYSLEG